jgi:hypothetical protein
MEIKKLIAKINTLSNNIQNAYKNDIEILINYIMEDFDICERGSNIRIKKEQILNYIQSKLNIEKKTCNALTKNNTLCTRSCYLDSDYCKLHVNKMFFDNQNKQIHTQINESLSCDLLVIENNNDKNNVPNKDLSKKFIDDSFYYIDSYYIYDTETYEKVGYIKNGEYILTDDPFILDELVCV